MSNMTMQGLVKNYTASGAVAPYRIVGINGDTEMVFQAAQNNDAFVGVSGVIGTTDQGGRLDVYKDGVRTVEYGGTVKAGEPVTADATGRAVKAEPLAGQTVRIIGFAEESAVENVRGQVSVAPQFLRG